MADILIRGMEMPTNVFDCPLNSFGICNLAQDETHCNCIEDSRPEWCPLLPLPEKHGRLIDADALNDVLIKLADNKYSPKVFASWLTYEENAPTIVPAEGGTEDGN